MAIGTINVHIFLLRGQMRGGSPDDQLTLLYVGRRLNLPRFQKKFFVEPETVETRKGNLLTYRKHMQALEPQADILFVDIGWPYNGRINARGEFLELPAWVCMVTTLQDTWEATVQTFRKTMRKNIGRLIRKNGYRCEPTNDPEIIKRYHDDFYKAFINSRHAGEVFMTPRPVIEQCARDGTILQVFGKDGVVAAGVYFPKGEELALLVTGMPEAYVGSPPEAAVSALYYFSLRYAFDNNYPKLNFMGTRAFPNDGVFQFKRKWGAVVEDTFSIGSILFKPLNNSAMAARFCEAFPMVARKGGALELVLCSTAPQLSEADRDRMLADSHCGGLDPVRIIHVSDQATSKDMTPAGAEQPQVKVQSATLGSFSQIYTRQASS